MAGRPFRQLASPAFSAGLLFVALAIPSSVAEAQDRVELRGRIVEMGSSRPLAAAEVFLPDEDRFVLSNENGDFEIGGLKPGVYRLQVEQLGYRTHEGRLMVGTGEPVRIELWPDPVVLEGLTAQVDRLRRRRDALAHSVNTLDRTHISEALSIESAIRTAGEVLVQCGSGADYCLWRRGQPVPPIVFIDERPAFGLEELRSYPVEAIQLVEVIGHRMIRAYTVDFMERLALGKASLTPVLLF
jgi:hypothetical protein